MATPEPIANRPINGGFRGCRWPLKAKKGGGNVVISSARWLHKWRHADLKHDLGTSITEKDMKEEHRLVIKVTPPVSLSKKLPDFGN